MRIGKWIVRIPAYAFMAGVHRFQTKRAAVQFRNDWLNAARRNSVSETPTIEFPLLERHV